MRVFILDPFFGSGFAYAAQYATDILRGKPPRHPLA
jgi:hypothetical protein